MIAQIKVTHVVTHTTVMENNSKFLLCYEIYIASKTLLIAGCSLSVVNHRIFLLIKLMERPGMEQYKLQIWVALRCMKLSNIPSPNYFLFLYCFLSLKAALAIFLQPFLILFRSEILSGQSKSCTSLLSSYSAGTAVFMGALFFCKIQTFLITTFSVGMKPKDSGIVLQSIAQTAPSKTLAPLYEMAFQTKSSSRHCGSNSTPSNAQQ